MNTMSKTIKNNELKQTLIGLNKQELTNLVIEKGEKSYRGAQIFNWVYGYGLDNFEHMTNLSKSFRIKLNQEFSLQKPKIKEESISKDGTRKWLTSFKDNQQAETVLIPDNDRVTLCISSQVGCTLTCKFCYTGTQRLVRNLTSGEIVGQIMIAKDLLNEWSTPEEKKSRVITNIVLMGMGEPLYNFDEVKRSIQIMTDEDGLAISRRKITLSTSGVVPQIEKCATELGLNLAISLHSPNDETRTKIMPINRKYPIKELMRACKEYPSLSKTKRVTFEYVMLKDVNDSDEDAYSLIDLVNDIPCKFNLIPFNAWPEATYECSSNKRIKRFQSILLDAGLICPIRSPRGLDILAACGQLRTHSKI